MRNFLLSILFSAVFMGEEFMTSQNDLKKYANEKDVIMVCSPGRSGSTVLRNTLRESTPVKTILKSHLLPPKKEWKGKIIFIFSNPDLAAESAFHLSLRDEDFIQTHFNNVETADKNWLTKLNSMAKNDSEAFMRLGQTFQNNLLTYDALGTKRQLKQWLITGVEKAPMEKSNVLAIKYEHLWDPDVIEAIKEFCGLKTLPLPPKRSRGYKDDQLTQKEELIRLTYNLGTESNPRFAAYDEARAIWAKAPKFQTYRLKK